MDVIFERVEYLSYGATLTVVQMFAETDMPIIARIDVTLIQKLIKASLRSEALLFGPAAHSDRLTPLADIGQGHSVGRYRCYLTFLPVKTNAAQRCARLHQQKSSPSR